MSLNIPSSIIEPSTKSGNLVRPLRWAPIGTKHFALHWNKKFTLQFAVQCRLRNVAITFVWIRAWSTTSLASLAVFGTKRSPPGSFRHSCTDFSMESFPAMNLQMKGFQQNALHDVTLRGPPVTCLTKVDVTLWTVPAEGRYVVNEQFLQRLHIVFVLGFMAWLEWEPLSCQWS